MFTECKGKVTGRRWREYAPKTSYFGDDHLADGKEDARLVTPSAVTHPSVSVAVRSRRPGWLTRQGEKCKRFFTGTSIGIATVPLQDCLPFGSTFSPPLPPPLISVGTQRHTRFSRCTAIERQSPKRPDARTEASQQVSQARVPVHLILCSLPVRFHLF